MNSEIRKWSGNPQDLSASMLRSPYCLLPTAYCLLPTPCSLFHLLYN
ncbi:hypothetical protein [Moorena producens]|nr:hypothetical protein [Moorena producens]